MSMFNGQAASGLSNGLFGAASMATPGGWAMKALPWLAGGLAGGLGLKFAPSQLDMMRKKLDLYKNFSMNNFGPMSRMYTNQMLRGSGGQQANLVGGANAFTSQLGSRLASQGIGTSGIGNIAGALGASQLGLGMANMYGQYNQMGGQMANQSIMQMLQMLGGEGDMKNSIWGALLGAGGGIADRTLFPR